MQKEDSPVTYPDFAEALQARICADIEAEELPHTARKSLDADERRKVGILEVRIATLEKAVAKDGLGRAATARGGDSVEEDCATGNA